MITALVSAVTGLVSGVVPDVIKEVRDSRSHTREKEFLALQHQMQLERMKIEAGSKLDDAQASLIVEEMRATREHLTAIVESQSKPTGIAWVDGFNAVLRPTTALAIMLLFIGTASFYVWAIVSQHVAGTITAEQMALVIWGSLVGESVQAVLGFLFGYRSARKISPR